MMIPAWAVSTFGGTFILVLAIAGWGIKLAIDRQSRDIEKVDKNVTEAKITMREDIAEVKDAVNELDKRVVRVETIMNGSGPHQTPPPPA